MSRSRKKCPRDWFNGYSGKQDKRMCNRILRRVSKQRIEHDKEPLFTVGQATKKMGGFKVWGKTIPEWNKIRCRKYRKENRKKYQK